MASPQKVLKRFSPNYYRRIVMYPSCVPLILILIRLFLKELWPFATFGYIEYRGKKSCYRISLETILRIFTQLLQDGLWVSQLCPPASYFDRTIFEGVMALCYFCLYTIYRENILLSLLLENYFGDFHLNTTRLSMGTLVVSP